jgi:PAS domain S-box-containing protein
MTINEKPYGIIRGFVDDLVRSGLPPNEDSLELYQIKRLNLTIISLVLMVPLFATIYLYLGVPQIAIGTFVTGLLAVFCFFWFRKTNNVILAANFILLIYAILAFLSAVYLGGINSSSLWWNTHLPVLAVLLLNNRWAVFWTVAVISEMFLFIFLTLSNVLPASPLYGGALMFHDSATKIVAITLLFVFGVLFILEKAKTIEILERAKTNISANAIYQATLNKQLDQYAEELARLYRASGALVSSETTDLNSLSQAIVEVVLREFGQSNCSLVLVDPDTSDLIRAAVVGPFAAEVSLVKLTLDGPGLVSLSIRSGEIVNVPDVRTNSDYVTNWEAASSEMVVPLKIGERVIGVIDVQSAELAAFDLDDEYLMTAFGERAALALERQRSTDTLQKLSRVVQQTADVVVITDPKGVIEYVNPAFEYLTGYTLSESLGQTHRMVKSGLHDDAFYQKMWRTILKGETFRGEVINRKKNGELLHVDHTITPLKTPQGEISHFVSTWKDITERVQAEDALRLSEERYRTVADFTYDWEYWIDPNGNYIYTSLSSERITGYRPQEFQQNPKLSESLIHPEDRVKADQHFHEHFTKNETLPIEFRIRTRAGEERWIEHICLPVFGAEGQWLGRRASNRDITERVQAEDARREGEERYRLLFNSLPYGGEVINTKGKILNCSLSTASMVGYEVPELIGKNITELLGPDSVKVFRQIFPKLLSGKPASTEIRMIRKDGTKLNILRAANPILDKNGKVEAILALNVDITERKQAEEQIRERVELMSRLAKISESLSHSFTLDDVATTIGQGALALSGADRAGLYYRSAENGIACIWSHNLTDAYSEQITSRIKELPAGHLREDPRPLLLRDIQSLPEGELFRSLAEAEGIRANSLWPLVYEKRIIAGVSCSFDAQRTWSEAEQEVMGAFARQAAIALQNALLFEDAQRRLKNLQALNAIDMAISGSVDLEITLDILLEQASTQLNVDAATVLLYDPHKQTLEFRAQRGFRTTALQYTRLKLGESHAGQAALENKTIKILDMTTGQTGFLLSPLLRDEKFISYLGVPLTAKGQIQGVLEIFHRSPLNPDSEWMELLKALSTQAAIAIDNATLFHDLQRSNVELIQAYDTTLEGWAKALELRDEETEGHTRRVTALTDRLAREMGMSDEEMIQVHRGALLHDIGKMGIPDSILLKPGKLTEKEWEIMRQHPVYAYNFISQIDYLRPAVDIPYCHHEKWDGTGYPRGLKGEKIPLSARIFAVIDVWDALNSDRPYRKAWKKEKVIAHIQEQSGTHFDPQVVEVFLALVDSE